MRGLIYAGLLFALICASAGEALPSSDPSPITVLSCVTGTVANGHLAVRVQFRNDGPAALSGIVWRTHLGGAWLDLPDTGTFAPGEVIARTVSARRWLVSGYYIDDAANCSAVEAKTAGGEEWKVPGFEPKRDHFVPTPRPNDATPVPATIENPAHDPIGIVSCRVGIGAGGVHRLGRKTGSGVLAVRFRNLSTQTIDRIVFRAAYLSGGFDFIFGGSFAPGVLISSDMYAMGTHFTGGRLMRMDLPVETPVDFGNADDDPSNCLVVSALYHDGTMWQNPSAGATEPPLPTAPPTLPPM